jgi:hypothetical protein
MTTALFGPYGSGAIDFIDRFEQFGANALWFHGFNGAAFDACQKHGITACVEFKTFRADFQTHPELAPIGVDGKPIRYGELVQGICLSQEEFLEETEEQLMTGLSQYNPTGIWLDYLTYAGWFETPNPDLQESCFCPVCIADFCEATGLDTSTPEQILAEAALEWERHKCERIARFASRYAELIRMHQPGCIVGAYMCPWQPQEYNRALTRIFAQDYNLLAPAIDIFTPLIYCAKSGRKPDWGREFLEAAPSFIPDDHPVQLILDVLDYPDSLRETTASAHPSFGLQMYGGGEIFSDPQQASEFSFAVRQIQKRIQAA